MLRFRVGPIPVQVHPSHFLVAAILGMGSGNASAAQMAQEIASWVLVVFVSVLIHELGHASAALAFGYRPDIQLIWLGGVTRPNAPGPIPWGRDVLLTLAGPFAGLCLGLLCGLLATTLAAPKWVLDLLTTFRTANLVWAVVNLIPVAPLDGGHVVLAVLRRAFGRRGELVALGFSTVIGLGVGLVAGKFGMLSIAVLFGLLGFQSGSLFAARWRSAASAPDATNQALARAEAALDEGRLEEAETLTTQVLVQETDPLAQGRANRILGWVALKRGQGRLALDRFSQVQRISVEPQALAAAFSLVGDEGRALPLWELAYHASNSPTVLHEWAGALIRAGKIETALALPKVQISAAYSCAERVLFVRGDYEGAAHLGEEGLTRAPTSGGAYDAACAYSRAGKLDDAMRLLHRAIELGFSDLRHMETDSDLGPLHTHSGWNELTQRLAKSPNR